MDKEKKKKPNIEGNESVGQPSNEEQMMRRQSAPRPTAESEVQRMRDEYQQRMQDTKYGVLDGFKALSQVIGKEQVQRASQILQKYKEGKANLEQRIVENEQWYKLRHWECLRDKKQEIQPTSAWLFNCIANKHADAMDNFPAPNILPREEGDKGEAEMLTSIVPVILDQCEFEQTYSDVWNYKLKTGTGVYGIFWDKNKLNGLGDISIKKVDIINLFWESGIQDIQKSRNFFHVELADNDLLIASYPQLQGKLTTATMDIAKYVYDDNVDTTNKSVVVDWYYKKQRTGEGNTSLLEVRQRCSAFCNGKRRSLCRRRIVRSRSISIHLRYSVSRRRYAVWLRLYRHRQGCSSVYRQGQSSNYEEYADKCQAEILHP